MASIQVFRGDPAAAIDAIDTCMGFDPLSPDLTLYFLAEARISLGQFDEAVTAIKQRLERNPAKNVNTVWREAEKLLRDDAAALQMVDPLT
jgi:hypothetical protein